MIDNNPIGLYIHIPFCRSKCPYCDFFSVGLSKSNIDLINVYTEKISKQIQESNRIFDTVYIGGGTPSVIGEENLAKILSNIRCTDDCEITVECNPSDTGSKEKDFNFRLLKEYGVNRISMGLQSSDNCERKILGRKSGCDDVSRAIERINNAGINNISLDLMLGVPEQTLESVDKSIDFCIKSGAKHISAYILKIEEDTYFGKNKNKYNFPDDDLCSDLYLYASDKIKDAGMNHYEISNFSYTGYESKHNLKYWNCDEYLGIGPAAHSFISGKRFF